ncbi:HIT family protein [Corynebacterium glutamicum]|jgi:diadenosine tetraphosphate (Ap4A) HIT family hydrolase|uniref:HIT family protein n=1 Tax=Corynebacterium glutamicum TaxID=1718 RepID=UPI0009421608|nr:HIT family protein [Corynebacterium glutamicum]OKX89039.1 HIT family protein [Corynebacterium glutamicum]QDQ21724.1 HIT family protein [Corynebacterium glutamicum]QDQ22763.1 HIT family protein [Corynebacterium glutamicum]QDX76453.1 HIT family hydrolase [Corynebacterium glutamicum]QDX79231.1 HIT family hydrolase [Corynebacterium glutamicum]
MASVFTKIINGELPGRFVYRSENVVAFLSIEPLTYGHTLVVPVAEVDRWTDLPQEIWSEVNEASQLIGNAIRTAFDAPRCGYIIAGFDVPHTHIHLFPTDKMADYDFRNAMAADATDPAKMDEAAEKIREALNGLV